MFSFINVKVELLHRGIIVVVRKRHHSVGLRVEAMKCLVSYRCHISSLYIYDMIYVSICDVTLLVAFLLYDTFIWGKNTKQGKVALNFYFS